MYTEWLATEHHRIHLIEEWPEGPIKEASLASARSALDSLLRNAPPDAGPFVCAACAGSSRLAPVIEYPSRVSDTVTPATSAA